MMSEIFKGSLNSVPELLGVVLPPVALYSPGKTRALLRHCEPPYRACLSEQPPIQHTSLM